MAKSEQSLVAVKKPSIATLGDGEVFIKRTQDGQIRSVKGMVPLEEANGEIAVISGKAMTTGKGFYHANQIAGLSIITPERLTLPEGQIVVNPFPIIDLDSGTIRKVWVKKMAIGYSPVGNMVITSATLLYDINMYFIQDLLKKVQYNAGSGRVCFENMLTDQEKQTGIFYKIDGLLGIWADVNHKEILKAIDTFISKKLFAERNAQTIAERLALAKHPALSHIAYVNAEGPEKKRFAKVVVIGYVNELTQKQLLDITAQAERGEEVKVNGNSIEVIETVVSASMEDMVVETDDEEKMVVIEDEQGSSELGQPGLFGGELF